MSIGSTKPAARLATAAVLDRPVPRPARGIGVSSIQRAQLRAQLGSLGEYVASCDTRPNGARAQEVVRAAWKMVLECSGTALRTRAAKATTLEAVHDKIAREGLNGEELSTAELENLVSFVSRQARSESKLQLVELSDAEALVSGFAVVGSRPDGTASVTFVLTRA